MLDFFKRNMVGKVVDMLSVEEETGHVALGVTTEVADIYIDREKCWVRHLFVVDSNGAEVRLGFDEYEICDEQPDVVNLIKHGKLVAEIVLADGSDWV